MVQKIEETLTGIVDEIVFQSEDSSFTVMVLDVNNEPITVVGVLPGVCVGEQLEVKGYFTTHPSFGKQFRALVFTQNMPQGARAIEKYLASGAIKGIGPSLARRIVDTFGDNTFDIIESNPERLCEVKGISQNLANALHENFLKVWGMKTVMSGLAGLGLSPAECVEVYRIHSNSALSKIKVNPYILCSAQIGVNFARADEIAYSMGFEYNDPKRIRAGCIYVLDYNFERDGHACIPYKQLISICSEFLQTSQNDTEIELSNAIDDGVLCHDFKKEKNEGFVYLPKAYYAERYVANRLHDIISNGNLLPQKNWDKRIEKLEKASGITYDTLQKNAISQALNSGFLVLSGGPGTGKTTTLKAIISLFEEERKLVKICAPTGRAAKRICELTGHDAKTIHRLLEVQFGASENKFVHDENNPLKADVIIIDEFSMVDLMLFESLLKAMKPSTRLILVGDKDQLPSVGCGNILKDLMDCDYLPIVELQHIFRQAAESLIVTNAHKIVCGEMPTLSARDRDFFFLKEKTPSDAVDTVLSLMVSRLPKTYSLSPTADIQVLCPSKQGELGTHYLNQLLQEKLNPADVGKSELKFGDVIFREGDKVMQTRNDYDITYVRENSVGKGIFNGDIGTIEVIDKSRGKVQIRFDDKLATVKFETLNEIEHAYAVTVHKSQGSEFEAVILPLMGRHKNLHYRRLLYTAVTRAKRFLIIVGQESTIEAMVGNHKKNTRFTTLKRFLDIEFGKSPTPLNKAAEK